MMEHWIIQGVAYFTSHNHWKGRSMEKWWIWRFDIIFFYHMLPNHCLSFKEDRRVPKTNAANHPIMIMTMIPTKKGPGMAVVTQFETNSIICLGLTMPLWRKPNLWWISKIKSWIPPSAQSPSAQRRHWNCPAIALWTQIMIHWHVSHLQRQIPQNEYIYIYKYI